MASTIIIPAQTTAATSVAYGIKSGITRTVSADGLAGAEYVDVLVEHGATYIPSGVGNRLTATEPSKVIEGAGNYKFQKSVTAAPVSVAFAYLI